MTVAFKVLQHNESNPVSCSITRLRIIIRTLKSACTKEPLIKIITGKSFHQPQVTACYTHEQKYTLV
jgi:hypothetical protein